MRRLQDGADRKSGTYVLIVHAANRRALHIGKRGTLDVVRGYYIYVGSAFGPGGVAARVGRHLRRHKTLHWHIDSLTRVARCVDIWYTHDHVSREHEWARLLGGMSGLSIPMDGFGASDCRCTSHLFFSRSRPSFERFRRQVERNTLVRLESRLSP